MVIKVLPDVSMSHCRSACSPSGLEGSAAGDAHFSSELEKNMGVGKAASLAGGAHDGLQKKATKQGNNDNDNTDKEAAVQQLLAEVLPGMFSARGQTFDPDHRQPQPQGKPLHLVNMALTQSQPAKALSACLPSAMPSCLSADVVKAPATPGLSGMNDVLAQSAILPRAGGSHLAGGLKVQPGLSSGEHSPGRKSVSAILKMPLEETDAESEFSAVQNRPPEEEHHATSGDALQMIESLAAGAQTESVHSALLTSPHASLVTDVLPLHASAPANAPEPVLATGTLTQEVGTPAWQQALGQQLASFTRDGVRHAELRLHPEELGALQVSLRLNNDQVQMHFATENHQVRAVLESAMPHLRTSLSDSGIHLGQSSVGSDTPSSWHPPHSGGASGGKLSEEESGDPATPEDAGVTLHTVNYSSGVNTFV